METKHQCHRLIKLRNYSSRSIFPATQGVNAFNVPEQQCPDLKYHLELYNSLSV